MRLSLPVLLSRSSPVRRSSALLLWLALPAALGGCRKQDTPASAEASARPVAAASAPVVVRKKPVRASGSALARSVSGKSLYLADEDTGEVRRLALPLQEGELGQAYKMEGPPAQILARDGEILVTVRDPGKLVVLAEEEGGGLKELTSIALPADAWGMALSPDQSTLLVTSAWTHTVSVIDLDKRVVVAKLDVGREPRGVVFAPDGTRAWVTHLVGTAVTKIELAGAASKAVVVPLAAGSLRAPRGSEPGASLAYAPVLSGDGRRLLVPRHALGTVSPDPGVGSWGGDLAWWGTATVDILLLASETPLAPGRTFVEPEGRFGLISGLMGPAPPASVGTIPSAPPSSFTQPRDAIWRPKTGSLLVVSEGTDEVTEHDPLALDPALLPAHHYPIGKGYEARQGQAKSPCADSGSAPQAIALSEDEMQAFVWARGSRELIRIGLAEKPFHGGSGDGTRQVIGPLPEPLSAEAATGRKLFYLGIRDQMSGGLACAGCHPEGRDDGFTWHQIHREDPVKKEKGKLAAAAAASAAAALAAAAASAGPAGQGGAGGSTAATVAVGSATPKGTGGAPGVAGGAEAAKKGDGPATEAAKTAEAPVGPGVFVGHPAAVFLPRDGGFARQTPMLAGRVSSAGPYGWHGQSKDLESRLVEGFILHRWDERSGPTEYGKAVRLRFLKAFVRAGLRPPPRNPAPLTPEEERGRVLFEDEKTQCKNCHPGATEFTTRASVPLRTPLPTRPGFATDEDQAFKVPSLLFLAGTAPYYHDGSAATLAELIEKNGNRMGNTSHLSPQERADLVAYLERL